MKPTDLRCYKQVAAVIGEALADYELQRVIDCDVIAYNKSTAAESFEFSKSPQGYAFWRLVNSSQNPYDHGHEKPDWVPDKKGFSVTIDPIDIMDDKPATKSEPGDKERSDGSTASYYELPEGATELQHLISHRNLNAQLGEIFRACYRYGLVSHSDMLRDAKKIKFYAQAEIERLEKLASASE